MNILDIFCVDEMIAGLLDQLIAAIKDLLRAIFGGLLPEDW